MIKALMIIMLIFVACQGQPFQVGIVPLTPPFEFLQGESTDPIGFSIDLLAAIAEAGNLDYEFINVQLENRVASHLFERIDVLATEVAINDIRKELYDFSLPYFLSTQEILAKEGTDITSAQDLVNKVVAVINGTTEHVAVEKIFGGDNPNILKVMTQDEAFQAVIDGQADAYVDDNAILEYFANNNPGYVVISDPGVFEEEFYGFMFPKGSELVSVFNEAMTTMFHNGEYTTIYNKWFGTDPDVDLLLAAGENEDPYDMLNENQEVRTNEEENCEVELLLWDE